MQAYKDVEKRREYQREWAKNKKIKKNVNKPAVESSPESAFCIQYYNMIKLRQEHKLSDFAYWIIKMRRANIDFMDRYGKYEKGI